MVDYQEMERTLVRRGRLFQVYKPHATVAVVYIGTCDVQTHDVSARANKDGSVTYAVVRGNHKGFPVIPTEFLAPEQRPADADFVHYWGRLPENVRAILVAKGHIKSAH